MHWTWQVLAVGLGGFVGAVARFAITGAAQRLVPGFPPLGTLLANVLGCFAIGLLMAWVVDLPRTSGRGPLPYPLQLVLITGLLGSFTTFSTFGYQTVELFREQDYRELTFYLVGNLAVGLAAVVAGRWLACLWWG